MWCNTAQPPRRCDNMIYNDVYFSQIDQNMGGCEEVFGRYMVEAGHLCNVISSDRALYVRDDQTGQYFAAGFKPTCKPYRSYRCIQGLNYQTIENVTGDLKVTWRITIPVGRMPLEIWDVRVENLGRKQRQLSLVTQFGMNCDGVDLFGGNLYRRAEFHSEVNAIWVRQDGERHQVIDFPLHNGFITADRKAASWSTNRDAFVGFTGTLAHPEALKHDLIPRTVATRDTPTGSLQIRVKVAAGKHADTRFLVGCCDTPPMIGRLRRTYLGGNLDNCRHFDAVKRERKQTLKNVTIQVPDQALETRCNVWLKHQIHYGAVHCRWGYKASATSSSRARASSPRIRRFPRPSCSRLAPTNTPTASLCAAGRPSTRCATPTRPSG